MVSGQRPSGTDNPDFRRRHHARRRAGAVHRQGATLAPFAAALKAADYRIANLECPIAESGTRLTPKFFTFRAHPRHCPCCKGVSTPSRWPTTIRATTADALLETMRRLDAAGIARFGAGKNLVEAHKPLWIERQG
jgi:poly-gamma-glutamate synthesis protein (capsule biosynthesis protein)